MPSLTTAREKSASLYPVLVLLGASILWGLSWLPLKYFAGYGIQGVTVTLVGHGSVGALAIPFLALRGRGVHAEWRGLLLLAALGGFANLAFATAMSAGDVVRVMVLFYLLPAWGVLGGWLWLGERIDPLRKLSLVLSLLGAFLVVGGLRSFQKAPTAIDILAVLSGMALASNNIVFRRLVEVDISSKVAAVFVGCLLWAIPLTFLGVQPLPSGVAPMIWVQLSAFGLVGLLVATLGTLWGVAHMEAGRSSVLIIAELVTAVASAAWLSHQNLEPLEWVGSILIVSAALLEARRPAAPETGRSPRVPV